MISIAAQMGKPQLLVLNFPPKKKDAPVFPTTCGPQTERSVCEEAVSAEVLCVAGALCGHSGNTRQHAHPELPSGHSTSRVLGVDSRMQKWMGIALY